MKKKLFTVLAAVLALIAVPAFAGDYLNEVYFGVKDLYVGEDGTFTFEGATDDTYEATFAITDPTADRTITFPNSSGTVALNPAAASWEFEGATADAYETTLTVVDPTADRTVTIPNESGAVILSTAGVAETAAAIWGASGVLTWEGATANTYETTFGVTDPTADRAVVLPDGGGAVLLSTAGVAETANAISGGTGTFIFEGSTADAYETTIAVTDTASSDKTITFPNATGTVSLLDSAITPPSINVNSGGAVTFLAKGQLTVVNGDTDTTAAVTGALTTDYVLATTNTGNNNSRVVKTAVISGAGVITITLSGDPGADTKVSYIVIR